MVTFSELFSALSQLYTFTNWCFGAKNKKWLSAVLALFIVPMLSCQHSVFAITFDAVVSPSPFSLTDVGTYSALSFADLDNDGDQDMIAGETGGDIYYFQNTGTVSVPSFAAKTTNPYSLTTLSSLGGYSQPCFVDLDHDLDYDLMVGAGDGKFYYYQNTGTVSAPSFAAKTTNPYSLTDIGSFSALSFIDLDNDGDLDLMAGESTGNSKYFQNTGTSSAPAFAAVSTNPFSITDIGTYACPAFADLDKDGDYDLMIGDYAVGDLYYFQNTGTATAPAFAVKVANPFSLTNIGVSSTPAFVDLDNDGDKDLMVGEYDGNYNYFKNIVVLPVLWTDLKVQHKKSQITVFWKTTLEENTSHFTVLRSFDGRAFEEIGKVAAAGFSSGIMAYQYEDLKAEATVNCYYKLRAYDLDGSSHESKVLVTSYMESLNEPLISNPVVGDASIMFQSIHGGAYTITIIDHHGRIVCAQQCRGDVGENSVVVEMKYLYVGLYYVQLSGPEYQASLFKVLKTNGG